jgi:hypothetical protein
MTKRDFGVRRELFVRVFRGRFDKLLGQPVQHSLHTIDVVVVFLLQVGGEIVFAKKQHNFGSVPKEHAELLLSPKGIRTMFGWC